MEKNSPKVNQIFISMQDYTRFSLEENQIPAAANSRVPRSNSAAASI